MRKETTKTVINEYDSDGKLLKSTETTVTKEYTDYYPLFPNHPTYPNYPLYYDYKPPKTNDYTINCKV